MHEDIEESTNNERDEKSKENGNAYDEMPNSVELP